MATVVTRQYVGEEKGGQEGARVWVQHGAWHNHATHSHQPNDTEDTSIGRYQVGREAPWLKMRKEGAAEAGGGHSCASHAGQHTRRTSAPPSSSVRYDQYPST